MLVYLGDGKKERNAYRCNNASCHVLHLVMCIWLVPICFVRIKETKCSFVTASMPRKKIKKMLGRGSCQQTESSEELWNRRFGPFRCVTLHSSCFDAFLLALRFDKNSHLL